MAFLQGPTLTNTHKPSTNLGSNKFTSDTLENMGVSATNGTKPTPPTWFRRLRSDRGVGAAGPGHLLFGPGGRDRGGSAQDDGRSGRYMSISSYIRSSSTRVGFRSEGMQVGVELLDILFFGGVRQDRGDTKRTQGVLKVIRQIGC